MKRFKKYLWPRSCQNIYMKDFFGGGESQAGFSGGGLGGENETKRGVKN